MVIEKPVEERIGAALSSSDVPKVYTNGFVTSLGTADVLMVLERNGQPAAVVNLAFTSAKTLALSLLQIIAQLEQSSSREIMTTHDVDKALNEKKNTQ